MQIRREEKRDYDAVYALVKEAFSTAMHSDGNEHDLVAALRHSDAFIPALSLVAEIGNIIVGHILFTEVMVGSSTELALAPLSVAPAYQRQGIGSALIRTGHDIARRLGYAYSIVLGSEAYYPHFGYRPAEQFGIQTPAGIPPANFMALPLQENPVPISGSVVYAKEFGL